MNLTISKLLNHQFIKYGIVGVLSVIIDYALLYISFNNIGLSSSLSITIGFWGSTVFNFLMHRFYTFANTKESNHLKALIKYLLLVFGSYFITLLLIEYLMTFNLSIYISKLIALIVVYIYGFFIGKYFVFK